HLHCQSGGRPRYDEAIASFVPGPSVQGERSVGAARGCFDLASCIEDGVAGGLEAAAAAGFEQEERPVGPAVAPIAEQPIEPFWRVAATPRQRAWVDLQTDVTVQDVELAARENFASIEHLKRYTTLGMGVDQGKTGNVNGIALLGTATGRAIADVGVTTFRPPFMPVTLGAIAGPYRGELYRPKRRLPAHDAHVELGAV